MTSFAILTKIVIERSYLAGARRFNRRRGQVSWYVIPLSRARGIDYPSSVQRASEQYPTVHD